MSKTKVVYYTDELTDDFAGTQIKRKPLGKRYRYVHKNPIFCFFAAFTYYVIAIPIVFLIQKTFVRQKFVNKKALKKCKKQGYFVYANHTQTIGDAFCGSLLTYPKRCYVISNPDVTSIRGVKGLVQMLGVIPLASTYRENVAMLQCLKTRIRQKAAIMVYPEANIWPFYTKIRPFLSTSFKYPVKLDAPVFCVTTCYQKGKIFKKPRMLSFIDGPFYSDGALSAKERAEKLRNEVYERMCARAEKYSTYGYITYIKQENRTEVSSKG